MKDGQREVARWQTTGKDFLSLLVNGMGYSYQGRDCGGNLPVLPSDEAAIAWMEANPVALLKSDRPSLKRVK